MNDPTIPTSWLLAQGGFAAVAAVSIALFMWSVKWAREIHGKYVDSLQKNSDTANAMATKTLEKLGEHTTALNRVTDGQAATARALEQQASRADSILRQAELRAATSRSGPTAAVRGDKEPAR